MAKDLEGMIDDLKSQFNELFGSDGEDADAEADGEDLDNVIVLNDENGEEIEFEFLDLIEYEGEEYVVLLPRDGSEEVVILKLEESDDDETESYASVDDEETLNTVFMIFKEKFKDEFNFTDDE